MKTAFSNPTSDTNASSIRRLLVAPQHRRFRLRHPAKNMRVGDRALQEINGPLEALLQALVTTNNHKPLIELRTHQSTLHYLDDNTLIDTKLSAAFDAWNHVQLVINPGEKSYCVFL